MEKKEQHSQTKQLPQQAFPSAPTPPNSPKKKELTTSQQRNLHLDKLNMIATKECAAVACCLFVAGGVGLLAWWANNH
jgi:hypothetical protein